MTAEDKKLENFLASLEDLEEQDIEKLQSLFVGGDAASGEDVSDAEAPANAQGLTSQAKKIERIADLFFANKNEHLSSNPIDEFGRAAAEALPLVEEHGEALPLLSLGAAGKGLIQPMTGEIDEDELIVLGPQNEKDPNALFDVPEDPQGERIVISPSFDSLISSFLISEEREQAANASLEREESRLKEAVESVTLPEGAPPASFEPMSLFDSELSHSQYTGGDSFASLEFDAPVVVGQLLEPPPQQTLPDTQGVPLSQELLDEIKSTQSRANGASRSNPALHQASQAEVPSAAQRAHQRLPISQPDGRPANPLSFDEIDSASSDNVMRYPSGNQPAVPHQQQGSPSYEALRRGQGTPSSTMHPVGEPTPSSTSLSQHQLQQQQQQQQQLQQQQARRQAMQAEGGPFEMMPPSGNFPQQQPDGMPQYGQNFHQTGNYQQIGMHHPPHQQPFNATGSYQSLTTGAYAGFRMAPPPQHGGFVPGAQSPSGEMQLGPGYGSPSGMHPNITGSFPVIQTGMYQIVDGVPQPIYSAPPGWTSQGNVPITGGGYSWLIPLLLGAFLFMSVLLGLFYLGWVYDPHRAYRYQGNNPSQQVANDVKSLTSVVISSKPKGASLFIDDAATGKVTPVTIRLAPGVYRLSLQKSGFGKFIQKIRVPKEKKHIFPAFDLPKKSEVIKPETVKTGVVFVDCNLKRAEIWINGQKSKRRTPSFIKLPYGSHRIQVKMWGRWGGAEEVEIGKQPAHIKLVWRRRRVRRVRRRIRRRPRRPRPRVRRPKKRKPTKRKPTKPRPKPRSR